MTTPPLPIDTSDIDSPLPDPAHEAMRQTVITALDAFWKQHVDLVAQFSAAQQSLAATQQALTALTARVAALENPPVPTPTP